MLPTGRVNVVTINSSRSQNQLKAYTNEQQSILKIRRKRNDLYVCEIILILYSTYLIVQEYSYLLCFLIQLLCLSSDSSVYSIS